MYGWLELILRVIRGWKRVLFLLWSFLSVGLRHLIHDSRLIHLLYRYILNALSLVELILLFNGSLTGINLLPYLIWLCYLNLLRSVHDLLLCTVWLLLYILDRLDVLLINLLLRLNDIDQLLAPVLIHCDLLTRRQTQNLLVLLCLVYWHLSNFTIRNSCLESFGLIL